MTELQKQLSEQFLHLLEEKNLEWKRNGTGCRVGHIIRFPRRFIMGAIIFFTADIHTERISR